MWPENPVEPIWERFANIPEQDVLGEPHLALPSILVHAGTFLVGPFAVENSAASVRPPGSTCRAEFASRDKYSSARNSARFPFVRCINTPAVIHSNSPRINFNMLLMLCSLLDYRIPIHAVPYPIHIPYTHTDCMHPSCQTNKNAAATEPYF